MGKICDIDSDFSCNVHKICKTCKIYNFNGEGLQFIPRMEDKRFTFSTPKATNLSKIYNINGEGQALFFSINLSRFN